MNKIFLATPAYDGKVHVQYAISLAETHTYLLQNGINLDIRINTSGSFLVAERNRLITAFLETDCTHMLFVDSDLGWPAQSVKVLLDYDEEFVCGVYPTKRENCFIFRPALKDDKSLIISPKNLVEMEYVPAGFMLIKRNVIEKLCERFQDQHYIPKDPDQKPGYCLFNTEVWEGEFWGEDYLFCRRVRECGFKIWADAMIEFDHAGVKGMLGSDFLSSTLLMLKKSLTLLSLSMSSALAGLLSFPDKNFPIIP